MLNYDELSRKLDAALELETKESLTQWLTMKDAEEKDRNGGNDEANSDRLYCHLA